MFSLLQIFIIPIQARTLLEYKFFLNFGNTFYDYSNNDRTGFNGNCPDPDFQDTIPTSTGAFFHSDSALITIPAKEIITDDFSSDEKFSINLWIKLFEVSNGQTIRNILEISNPVLQQSFSCLLDEKLLLILRFSNETNEELLETKAKIQSNFWISLNFHFSHDFFQVSENQAVLSSLNLRNYLENTQNLIHQLGGLAFQSSSILGFLWKVTFHNDQQKETRETLPTQGETFINLPEPLKKSLIFSYFSQTSARKTSESLNNICSNQSEVNCLTCLCQNSNCELDPVTNSSKCKCPAGVASNSTFCICPKQRYFTGTSCESCGLKFCDFCLNDTWCLDCSAGFVLIEGQCECPEGYYLSMSRCTACSRNCLICFNSTSCTTCRSGYYLADNSCKVCGNLCSTCEVDKCTNCSDPNAKPVSKTRTCKCLNGFRLEQKCKVNYFFISSIENNENLVTVVFSEKTSEKLELKDFSLEFQKTTQPRIQFEAVSREKYEFKINSFLGIEKGDVLTVKVKNLDLKSEAFSSFKETSVQVRLEYERKVPENVWKVVKISRNTLLAMLIVAACFGLAIGSSVFWTLFNTFDLLSFLPLGSIPYPKVLAYFFKLMNPISFFPSPFDLIMIPRITEPAYLEARKFGITNSIFFYNLEVILTVLAVNLIMVLLIFAFSALCKGWMRSIFSKILQFYRFGHFLRFLTSCSLEIAIFALVQLKTVNSNQINFSRLCLISTSFSILFLVIPIQVIVGLSPFIILCMSQKFFNKISDPSQESFYLKWGNLFEDFRNDRGFMSSQFYSLFLIRRIVFAFAQVYLNSIPLLQSGFLLFWTCLVLVFCLKFRIFKDLALAVSVFLNEGVVLVVVILSMILFADLRIEQVETIEMLIVGTIFSCLIVHSVICISSLVYKCFYKEKQRKVDKVTGITKVVPTKAEVSKSALNTSTL